MYANSVKSPSYCQHVKRGGDTCQPRGLESSDKGCYRHSFSRYESIHLQHFHHPKEGWGEKVSGTHVRTESVCKVSSPFKMEDISQLIDILWRGDYMTKLDL